MEINNNKFEDSIKQILELLYTLLNLMKAKNRLNGENILDNQDVCRMFNMSTRSLQRYRNSGELPFIRIGGKPFYIESEVHAFINTKRHNNPSDEDSPEQ